MTLLRCCISTHLTFQVSQGSAATDLRWGENFNKHLFHNSFPNTVVKKLRKSVNICQSYRKNKRGTFFMAHGVCLSFSMFMCIHKWKLKVYSDCLQENTTTSTSFIGHFQVEHSSPQSYSPVSKVLKQQPESCASSFIKLSEMVNPKFSVTSFTSCVPIKAIMLQNSTVRMSH